MTTSLGTTEIKARLSEIIGRIRFGDERVIVLRRGRPVAALVSIHDLRRLEAAEAAESGDNSDDGHPIMRAFGGWADRTDIDDLLVEIYANRDAATGRAVAL